MLKAGQTLTLNQSEEVQYLMAQEGLRRVSDGKVLPPRHMLRLASAEVQLEATKDSGLLLYQRKGENED